MLQNLIKILMFLTVLLMSTSSLHLNQNRLIPVELSTLNSYRRQQLPSSSSLLNDHHHYHNDQYHQTRSIRDRQPNKRSQLQQQQHRIVKSIELNDDDDDFGLINSEYLPHLHRYQPLNLQQQQQQEQQQQQQQLQLQQQQQEQQQQFHPKIFHTQQISNRRNNNNNNNLPPTSSFFNSHNQFNGRFTGSSLPSSTITSPYDYRNNLINYRHRTQSIPIYKQMQQQQQQQLQQQHEQEPQHDQEKLLPISMHHLLQHHPSLPLNIRGNVDEGGGISSSSITINNDFIDNGNSRDSTGIGLGDNENYIRIGVDNIDDDTTITGHRHIDDGNGILKSSNSKNVLTSDDIDSLMMLNDDIYSGYTDPTEKFIKNSDTNIRINNKNNKITGTGNLNNPFYDTNNRNSQIGLMNSNDNSNNKNSLSNSNINTNTNNNNNNQFQLQPPKALQELFQQQQQKQKPNDKQLNTNALQLKLASLDQQTSSLSSSSNEEYDLKDDYKNRRLSSSLGSSTTSALDNRIKQKEEKIKLELLKRQQQLKKITNGKSGGKQNEQKRQKMQKDQQVNNDDGSIDSFINSDTLSFQKDNNKELNSNNKKQQNQNNKLRNNNNNNNSNNNNNNNNNRQQKRQQKKDLQQTNKRNVGNVGGLQSNISPVSHSIANQLMLRNTRGQRQYDVPQIECPSAMDGMERFACPSPDRQGRYRCIDDHVLCDGFIDCPEGEDEERSSCMFYKTTKAHLDVLADALLRWARGR